jgi:hypothetical protein
VIRRSSSEKRILFVQILIIPVTVVVVTASDGKVQFSSVLWPFLLNPELNQWFGSGVLPDLRTEPLVPVQKGSVQVHPPLNHELNQRYHKKLTQWVLFSKWTGTVSLIPNHLYIAQERVKVSSTDMEYACTNIPWPWSYILKQCNNEHIAHDLS